MHTPFTLAIARLLQLPAEEAPFVALSIRQPWADLILNNLKDVENRTWPSRRQGWVLIHASSHCPRSEHESAIAFAMQRVHPQLHPLLPRRNAARLGGIVGAMRIAPSDPDNTSPWRMPDQLPIPILEAVRLPFIPCEGRLGYFTPEGDTDAIEKYLTT